MLLTNDYYEDFAYALHQFSYGIIPLATAIIGIIGNSLVVCVYCRKKFAKCSLKLYFISLAISDSFSLLPGIKIFLLSCFKTDFALISEFTCRVSKFSDYNLPAISSWTLVIISFDRMMKITYAMKAHTMNKTWFQVVTLLLIYSLNTVLNLPQLVYRSLVTIEYNPNPSLKSSLSPLQKQKFLRYFIEQPQSSNVMISYYTFNEANDSSLNVSVRICHYSSDSLSFCWIQMVQSSILPFILMFIFSGLTIFFIFKSRQKIFSNKCMMPTKPSSLYTITAQPSPKHCKSTFSKDKYFAINSIALDFIFLFSTLPILVLRALSTKNRTTEFNPTLVLIFINIFYVNFASLLFINFFSNSIFRAEFLFMIRLKNHKVHATNYKKRSLDSRL